MTFEFDNFDGISLKTIETDYNILQVDLYKELMSKLHIMKYHANQNRIIGKSGKYCIVKTYVDKESDPKNRYWFLLKDNKAIYGSSLFQENIDYIEALDICVCNIADNTSDIIDMNNGNIYSIKEDYRKGYELIKYNRDVNNN